MAFIKLENINYYYDKGRANEVHALKDINLEINKGEYVAFFGPSGCGKTTLLYLIAGIEGVEEGKLFINNKEISQLSKKELAIYRQVGVGIVFQTFNLIPSLSVADNVALPMTFFGISKRRRIKEALKLLDRLGIKNLADRLPSELSGGQQQRVGIARALANNPPIIVADEPLGNLDSENAKKVLEFLKELNEKDGRTIIMVTHEAWSLRDVGRVFYMKDGAIIKTEKAKAPQSIARRVSEHVYQELVPGLSPSQRISQVFARIFLKGYSPDEMRRFEFFFTQRLENKIDDQTFMRVIDRPFKDGGVGLWKQTAKKITAVTKELIKRKKDLSAMYKIMAKYPNTPLDDEVRQIGQWLLEEYTGKISPAQQAQLEELISERIRKIITAKHFKKILGLSKKDFGVGLSFRASQRLSERLEALLASQHNNNKLSASYESG